MGRNEDARSNEYDEINDEMTNTMRYDSTKITITQTTISSTQSFILTNPDITLISLIIILKFTT